MKYRILFIICIIGISVYAILFSGWRSNSKYSILGRIRACAQSISYEISLSIIIFSIIIFIKRYNTHYLIKIRINLFLILFPLIIC
jgi:NADH:ubiquinone oxidoreductase subunit H